MNAWDEYVQAFSITNFCILNYKILFPFIYLFYVIYLPNILHSELCVPHTTSTYHPLPHPSQKASSAGSESQFTSRLNVAIISIVGKYSGRAGHARREHSGIITRLPLNQSKQQGCLRIYLSPYVNYTDITECQMWFGFISVALNTFFPTGLLSSLSLSLSLTHAHTDWQ